MPVGGLGEEEGEQNLQRLLLSFPPPLPHSNFHAKKGREENKKGPSLEKKKRAFDAVGNFGIPALGGALFGAKSRDSDSSPRAALVPPRSEGEEPTEHPINPTPRKRKEEKEEEEN